jgi:hypothetical protein
MQRLFSSVPAIVLWGSFGGICLAAEIFLLQAMWDPVLEYNSALSPVYQFQMMGSCAILFWILGAIAADLFRTGRGGWLDPVITGLLSGICTALIFAVIIVSNDMVSHPSVVQYANDPFGIRVFLDRLFRQWRVPLAGFIIVSGILQALGAWYHGSRQRPGPGVEGIPHRQIVTGRLYSHRFLLLALVAFLLVPPALAYLGMSTGIVEEQYRCCKITDRVEVSRTGPDSICIVMVPDPERTTDSIPAVKIFIDEIDVSNQSIITGSGLDETLDPPEGLRYKEGASVILKGKHVTGNGTGPARIRVIVWYPETGSGSEICNRKI